jgi:hypothetical protein
MESQSQPEGKFPRSRADGSLSEIQGQDSEKAAPVLYYGSFQISYTRLRKFKDWLANGEAGGVKVCKSALHSRQSTEISPFIVDPTFSALSLAPVWRSINLILKGSPFIEANCQS